MKMLFVIKPDQGWRSTAVKSPILLAHYNPGSLSTDYGPVFSSGPAKRISPSRHYDGGSEDVTAFELVFDDDSITTVQTMSLAPFSMDTQESLDWLRAIQKPANASMQNIGLEILPPLILFIWGDRPVLECNLVLGTVIETKHDFSTKKAISAKAAVTLYAHHPTYLRY